MKRPLLLLVLVLMTVGVWAQQISSLPRPKVFTSLQSVADHSPMSSLRLPKIDIEQQRTTANVIKDFLISQ